MPKVVREYRELDELKRELTELNDAVEKAVDSCTSLLGLRTEHSHLRYVQKQFVDRAINFFRNTAEQLEMELSESEPDEVLLSDDPNEIGQFFPLMDARRGCVDLIESRFIDCPIFKILRPLVLERINISGASIVFELEQTIYDLEVTRLEEIPMKHPLRDFLVNGCGFDLGFTEPTTITVNPEPASVTASARSSGRLQRGGNFHRILNWPQSFRTDLSSHPNRFRFVPEKDAFKKLEKITVCFEHYLSKAKRFDSKHFRSRVPFGELPILIEELPFVSSETITACYDSGFYTIPELITIDEPVRLLKEIKRLGHQRLFELQCGLAELGAYRFERDIMAFEKPSDPVSLRVRDLDVSILHKLRFETNWLVTQMANADLPLHEAFFPDYEISLGRHAIDDPEHWVISLPRVTPKLFAYVFGEFGTSGYEIEALDTFQEMSLNKLEEIMRDQFDGEGYTAHEVEAELDERRVFMIGIIESYAAFKAIYAQDRNGFSWYDHKFGHMPWIVRNDDDREFDSSEELDPEVDYTSTFIGDDTDFTTAKDLRGVRGVPLSAYGKIKKREHPVWWKKD